MSEKMSKPINSEEAFERFFRSLKILNRPPRLSNLPNVVIKKIIKKCELRDLLALRNVSKHFRNVVDARVKYNGIKVSCRRDHVLIELRYRGGFSRYVVYAGVDWNSEVVFSNIAYKSEYTPDRTVAISVGKECEVIKSEDYEKMAFFDLAIVLKNPKIEVGCFTFEYYVEKANMPITVQDAESSKRFYEKMRTLLSSLNHKLLVSKVKLVVEDPDGVLAILPYVVPVFLQEIEINSEVSTNSWQNQVKIERIVNLEQWMKVKDILKTKNTFEFFPMEHLVHFERFRIYQSFSCPRTNTG
ncbi:hypothetical protein GCK72_008908 [Caenorhabditis remanei]|uniref:F-box domain-containing protein n=1 Tax=Caenorhabditis remanei TaxID=31234 RepID=A0A6A5H0Y0_CAERE|nr:hypothetical protein GCK72_008908 [Caenorhabditis remanei]KAF1760659.1 hypothetical protein GCK72_008908 [Caenorhabditis remanei]